MQDNITSSDTQKLADNDKYLEDMLSIPCQITIKTNIKQTAVTVLDYKRKRCLSSFITRLIEDEIKRATGETQDTVYLSSQYKLIVEQNEAFKREIGMLTEMLQKAKNDIETLKASGVGSVQPATYQPQVTEPIQYMPQSQPLVAQTTIPKEKPSLKNMKSFFQDAE